MCIFFSHTTSVVAQPCVTRGRCVTTGDAWAAAAKCMTQASDVEEKKTGNGFVAVKVLPGARRSSSSGGGGWEAGWGCLPVFESSYFSSSALSFSCVDSASFPQALCRLPWLLTSAISPRSPSYFPTDRSLDPTLLSDNTQTWRVETCAVKRGPTSPCSWCSRCCCCGRRARHCNISV